MKKHLNTWKQIVTFFPFFVHCSIPFSVDDISKSMPESDLSDIDPPNVLRENPGFFFLQPQAA